MIDRLDITDAPDQDTPSLAAENGMGAWGALIMSFFGAVFAAFTLYWQQHLAGPTLALPFLVFAAIASAAAIVIRLPGTGLTPSPKVERAIMWSSMAEGGGIFIASNVVLNLHRPDLLLPSLALVVGLHFLPIALAARFKPFYYLGAALVAAAILGVVIKPPVGGDIAGFAAAACLWTAAALAVLRDWRAKRSGQILL